MREEAIAVAANVKVTAAAVAAKEEVMVVAEAETEEVLVEVEDVKVEAVQVAGSEISLENHVKAEAVQVEELLVEAEREDADLNQHTQ